MSKFKLTQITVTLLAAGALSMPLYAADETKKSDKPMAKPAASTAPAAASAGKTEASEKALPFRGKIATVDKAAKSFTIESKKGESRTYVVSDAVKPTKGETVPPALDALNAGEEVSGTYRKGADDKREVVSLKIGAKEKTDKTENPKTEKAAKADKTNKTEKSDKAETKPAM